jgi:hypothetical protein
MYYITINVQYVRYSTGRKIKYFIVYRLSFVYKASDVRILMRANPLQGTLEGVGHLKTETFLDPEMAANNEASAIWAIGIQ